MLRRFSLLLMCACLAVGTAAAQTNLNGAGATFPYPIYSKWFNAYHNAHSDVQINYQSIGSGGGIRQLTAGTVDFGASDGPMSDAQLAEAKRKIYHLPTVLGSVVPAYNVPGVKGELKFTGKILADIFMGKITSWNDAQLTKLNPGVNLPGTPIVVAHRSDGSGTTYIWTDYLSKVSPDWQGGPGKGTSVKWPVGLGAKGNEGVAGLIRQMEGGIGYVELIYALQNNISYGVVQNAAVGEDAAGLPCVDHQPTRQGRLSDRELHVAADSGRVEGRQQGQDHGGLPELDARPGAERSAELELCAASEGSSREGTRGDQDDQVVSV